MLQEKQKSIFFTGGGRQRAEYGRFRLFWGHVEEKEEFTGEEGKGTVSGSLKSHQEKMRGQRRRLREQRRFSILPRWKNERCGRRTERVMVKRSDGDKKGKRREKKTGKWPWEDF